MEWSCSSGQTSEDLWYHILCLDSEGTWKQVGCKESKMYFLGVLNTSKDNRMYDEVNKKFILSRDVIFLESYKDDKTLEQKLDHLDKFNHRETYYECDNKIPHIEGGIPILDQSLESPFEAPYSPHEQVSSTSLENHGQLDDVIERIERLSLEDNESPSRKLPKWAMTTLESVHLDEIGKTRTRSSIRQDDGGNADYSNSSDTNSRNNVKASIDCELDLSTNSEPNSFE